MWVNIPTFQVAVDRYGEVIQNLEFARDLQKQFNMINVDVSRSQYHRTYHSLNWNWIESVRFSSDAEASGRSLDSMKPKF